MPRHSLRVRRDTPGEEHYRGWASTEYVDDLRIPVVVPDVYEALTPWFGPVSSLGAQRRLRDGDSAPGASGRTATRRRRDRRVSYGVSGSVGTLGVPRTSAPPYWTAAPPVVAAPVLTPVPEGVSHPPAGSDDGGRLWYDGVGAAITRNLGADLQVSWGDVPPAAGVVCTALALTGVLDSLQWSLDDVDMGRSTLLVLRAEVARDIDRQAVADRWNTEVYAVTREWPRSLDRAPLHGGA